MPVSATHTPATRAKAIMDRKTSSFLILLCCLLLPAAAAAQTAATTGQIIGRVANAETGAPVPSASVVVVNRETGLQRGTLTRANGTYTILLLPPGSYDVTVQILGFATTRVENVRVALGQTANVNFELQVAAVALEGVEVRAAEAIDVRGAAVSQTVGQSEIEELPALGRDFTDFVNLSGLVSPSPETTTGGQFAIGGQRPSQTNLQIDGVDANNSFFGENRGGSRQPFTFSLESIREFQIITNGYDVEFGNYSGGVVNVITRGGTNTMEGTVYGNYRGAALTGPYFRPIVVRQDTIRRPEDYEVSQWAARLSGPIIQDRLFYLVSVDGQRRREPQVPIMAEAFQQEDPATFQAMNRYFDVLETRYGVPNAREGYQPFQTSNDVITLFGRVDWNLNQNHRLSLRHNYANYTNANEWNPNFDFLYGISRAEELTSLSNSFVTELQSVLGPATSNVLRMQLSSEGRPRMGNDLRPELQVNLGTGQSIRYGGTFAAFQNNMEERKFQVVNNLTHMLGNHVFKVGANVIGTNILNQFILNGSGVYAFASLEDFENMRPRSYTRFQRADGEVPEADFNVYEWSLYGQGELQLTPRLTTTLGLRYDQQAFVDRPGRVIEVEQAFGLETGIAPIDRNNFSPRLSLAYDLRGDGASVLRAGAGYFYGRVPYVLGGNVAQTETPVLQLICTGSALDGDPDAPPSPAGYGQWSLRGDDNPINCAGAGDLRGIPTYTFWNQNFEYPETFKASLGYEQLLGRASRLGVDLTFSNSVKLYTVRDINMRGPQFTIPGEGGRRVFVPPSQFNPALGATQQRLNTEFGNVFVNYNDGREQAFSVNLEGAHRFTERSGVRGSYTFTRSYDNSSYSCCTANAGFSNPNVGIYGPNDIGGFGETDKAWGPSSHVRNHTFILAGNSLLPWRIQLSGFWRLQSGRPWTAEQGGDLNADGLRFNDRPFVFAPENLPLAATGAAAEEQRERYAGFLADNPCVGDHVGSIVPRNSCRQPWFNRLDMRLSRRIQTVGTQGLELQLDIFNVLNLLNNDWGQYMGVFGARRNLMAPVQYDAANNRILYQVPIGFGEVDTVGTGLLLQWQLQAAVKYFF
jgi:hypothetical protein